jgi:hypothetical protein
VNIKELKLYLSQIPDEFEVRVKESDWVQATAPKLKTDSDRGITYISGDMEKMIKEVESRRQSREETSI